MKNLITSALLLLALLLPATAAAYDFEADGIYYNLCNDEGTVEVTAAPYTNSYSGAVTIPNTVSHDDTSYTVTAIGEWAFANSSLASVSIPNTVTTIGDYAFWICSDLTSVNIPNSVITIGKEAFLDCGLTNVTIGNSVTTIGSEAFSGCSKLTSVTIPGSVTNIGNGAFWNCTALTRLSVESGNMTYDSRENCNAIIETATNTLIVGCQNTIIPNTVTSIGDNAFDGCEGLTSVNIPNSVTAIGGGAFWMCEGLTSVTIPSSVTYIGTYAFAYCKYLTSVDIPNSVTDINRGLFYSCESLTSVDIPNSVTAIGEQAFSDCESLLNVTIPNSVTFIGTGAFAYCSSLKSVTLPSSVTSMGNVPFYYCSGLRSLEVENGNPTYDSRENCNAIIETATNKLIAGCINTIIPNTVTAIGISAFGNCIGLTSMEIPNSVTKIDNYAFVDCFDLKSVNIPNAVDSIGSNAFYYCKSLTSMDIPNSVTFIGEYAFALCSSLKSLTIGNSVTFIGKHGFAGCESLTSVDIPNSVTYISEYLFSGCSSLTRVTIPNSVTYIGGDAFYGCSGLTRLTIPNSVTYIGSLAFALCTGLTRVTIPNSVTYIDYGAFMGCSGMKSVIIPSSVTTISNGAFRECSGLTDVYSFNLDPSAILMGDNLFVLESSDYSDRTLHVPHGMTDFYQADGHWYPYFEQIVDDLMRGDVNGDGEVNIADINALIDIIMGDEADDITLIRADVNSDGEINIADINAIIEIIMGGDEPISDDHEYIDLGLSSGTQWAMMNVGANSPEEYGDYFAWGETTTKTAYSWDTYKWCTGSWDSLTKYCTDSVYGTVDNKTELEPANDAAYVKWGPWWRMPTIEQLNELMDDCYWQWESVNGVNGFIVTGPNGNSIFLPAAGYRYSSSIYGEGSYGSYWSRMLYSDRPRSAYDLDFGEGSVYWSYYYRYYGFSVRAVRVK